MRSKYMKELKFVEDAKGCHNVISHKCDYFGYPKFSRWIGNEEFKLVHRWVYTTQVGPIPRGLVVRHKCDNPKCINIKHLELGTILDNVKDRCVRGRTSRASRCAGLNNGGAKLNPELVKKIRNLEYTGSQMEACKQFGISQSVFSSVRLRKTWRHVE